MAETRVRALRSDPIDPIESRPDVMLQGAKASVGGLTERRTPRQKARAL
jgi:hypothetical protein